MRKRVNGVTEKINQLNGIIAQLTGHDVVGEAMAAQGGATVSSGAGAKANGGGTMASAQKNAQTANMTSYGERLAQRAKPDMNRGSGE